MEIKKRQFTEQKQLSTFRNRFGYSEVTEYTFETTRNMNDEDALNLLKENGFTVYGFIQVIKSEIDFSIEQMAKVFRYVIREVEYV